MKVAIEGCCHGELDKIYETLEGLEKVNGFKVDILLICGDFQSVRNLGDMNCMAIPQHHRKMQTFYKYYSGEKVAPVLTVFIGGNHEASNYLQELPYGGWVAPNIYYMGYAGVVQFGGVRIGGLSGIFKGKDYLKGHFERCPYSEDTKRSAYHVRNLEVFRLKQLSRQVDIFMSHDWPRGIYNYGNVGQLKRYKKFLAEEIEQNSLGSPPAAELLRKLQPAYWFSAHLHVKFAAMVQHSPENDGKVTRFLSLDKCLPKRNFLQVIDVPHNTNKPLKLELDPEWLAILKLTNHLMNLTRSSSSMPGPGCNERFDFRVTDEEIKSIVKDFGGDLSLPNNFTKTVPVYNPTLSKTQRHGAEPVQLMINPQTTLLCSMLDLTDPNTAFLGKDTQYKISDGLNIAPGVIEDESATDDDVDEDYESEQSFVSQSGSEQSFSDRSYSFLSTGNESLLSTGNESFSSLGNPDEIDIGDESEKKSDDQNVSIQSLSQSVPSVDDDDDEELQQILKAQKKALSQSKLTSVDKLESNNGNNSEKVPAQDEGDDEDELEAILSAQKMAQSQKDISSNSTTSEVDLSSDAEKMSCNESKSSMSISDTSTSGSKVLEASDGDLSMQEMIAAQRRLKSGLPSTKKQVMEISETESDVELQEIMAAQRQNLELTSDLQVDLEGLKPVYQSSPAVSMEDRADQSLSMSFEKSASKRTEAIVQKSPTKKFRRRNQEIYLDPSTEEYD